MALKSPIPEWTDAKFKGWIISLLRKGTMRWPPRNECLSKAKTKKKINKKTNRLAQHYRCSGCRKEFPMKEVVVDHIEPVVDVNKGFTTWDDYVQRMFCGTKGLQVLCKTCHDVKCTEERQQRKKKC